MKDKDKSLLYNLPAHAGRYDNLSLLRIIRSDEFIKVDFGYYAPKYYDKGGWIRISKDTFVRDKKTQKKYKLIHAENIPIAPTNHHFKTTNDWTYFSLSFEPIPESVKLFDLIEAEPGDRTDFNFYDIRLNSKTAIEIINL